MKVKKEPAKEQVTEDMLNEVIGVFISETESSSLLDMLSTFVCVDAEGAEAIVWVKSFPFSTGTYTCT